jgi:hypothetical protein
VNFDQQKDYSVISTDLFYDQPLPGKNGMTFQAAYSHYDGGTTFLQLPPQHVWFFEAGYYNMSFRLGPFIQAANRNFEDESRSDLAKYTAGLAYWPMGHRMNVKIGAARAAGDPKQDYWQVVLQAQIYIY